MTELAQVRPAELRSGDLLQQAYNALAEVETLPDLAAIVDRAEIIRVAARKAKAGRRIQNDWAEFKLRAQRRGGEMLDSDDWEPNPGGQPEQDGYPLRDVTGRPPTLVELGLGVTSDAARRRAFRWREVARIPSDAFEGYIARVADPEHDGEDEITTAGLITYAEGGRLGATAARLVESNENEWYTPARYIDAVRTVLGHIDLDPASSDHANQTVRADRYFTKDDDGLEQEWRGRVFLNPPYGRWAGEFVTKLVWEHQEGRVTSAIALVNAHCTDTDWFQALWDYQLCFTDHRIDFDSAGRDKHTTSTHGSVFVHLGGEFAQPERFRDVFAQFGAVVWRCPP